MSVSLDRITVHVKNVFVHIHILLLKGLKFESINAVLPFFPCLESYVSPAPVASAPVAAAATPPPEASPPKAAEPPPVIDLLGTVAQSIHTHAFTFTVLPC